MLQNILESLRQYPPVRCLIQLSRQYMKHILGKFKIQGYAWGILWIQ